MPEVIFAVVALVIFIAVGLNKSYPDAEDKAREQPLSTDGPYPNGSVPYGDCGKESALLRAKRFACAGVNHHPRRYDGSWCGGYGYVCGRCYMYADPIPKARMEAIIKDLNDRGADQMDMAAAFGGGPRARH